MPTKPFSEVLFPTRYRQAAAVAWLRTFYQCITGTVLVAGAGTLSLTASSLLTVNWASVALGAAAVTLSSVVAATRAACDVLANGLPDAYGVTGAVPAPPVAPEPATPPVPVPAAAVAAVFETLTPAPVYLPPVETVAESVNGQPPLIGY